MSKKTVIQECIKRSSRLDFMHWFHANKDRLLNQEKEQLIESYFAGTAQFDNAAPIVNPKTPQEYYTETFGSCGFHSEMFERLVNSHFRLFRTLNQIGNKEPQSEATHKALEEAREVNRFFSDKDSPRIVQS